MRFHLLGLRIQMGDLSRPLWIVAIVFAVVMLASSRRWVRYLAAAVSAAAGALALVAMAQKAEPMPPVGDVGVIEIYIFDALKGRLLVGPYSHFNWHHPGPIYFYLLAPFYALSGYLTTGAAAGALAINIASVGLIAWTARRMAGRPTAIVLTAACLFYCVRFERVFTSQWNPHVLVLPTLAFVVVAAATAAGATGFIPLLIALGSFAAQTHLGLAPTVAALSVCALAAAFWGARRQPPEQRRALAWRLNAGLWVAAILWFPPIVEQMTRADGNLSRLWRFFAGGTRGQTIGAAVAGWSNAITGAVRSGFVLAWGAPMDIRFHAVSLAVAAVMIAGLGWAGVRTRRAGQRFVSALAAGLLLALFVALFSASRIAGEIVDHEVFWMSGLGACAIATIAGEAGRALALRATRERPAWLSPRTGDVLCVALLGVFVWRGVADLSHRIEDTHDPGDAEVAALTLADEIEKYDRREGSPKLRMDIDGPAWGVAAAVAVQLERHDVPFGVFPQATWMFGDVTAVDGTETRTVQISAAAAHDEAAKAGAVPLADRRGFYADLTSR